MQDNFIYFTEESNAIDYLEKTCYFLDITKQSPINWKWVICALHGALYGFAICALTGVHRSHVYKDRKCSAHKRELITLDEALRKCQKPNIMNAFEGSQPLVLTESQKKSIHKMKTELRNNFEHYIPKTWCISTDDLPCISDDVLDVIFFLAIKTETNVHVLREFQKIKNMIDDCKKSPIIQSHCKILYPAAHPRSLD